MIKRILISATLMFLTACSTTKPDCEYYFLNINGYNGDDKVLSIIDTTICKNDTFDVIHKSDQHGNRYKSTVFLSSDDILTYTLKFQRLEGFVDVSLEGSSIQLPEYTTSFRTFELYPLEQEKYSFFEITDIEDLHFTAIVNK